MSKKMHWMKFYPSDWQSDICLRSCSISARGLWVELLCIMQKSEPQGYLIVGGKLPTCSLLSTLCGVPEKDVKRYMRELENAGVFSRLDDGTVFSRRIVRDAERAKKHKQNGSMGGSPLLKQGVNPPDKAGVKPQRLEARDQRLEERKKEPQPDGTAVVSFFRAGEGA